MVSKSDQEQDAAVKDTLACDGQELKKIAQAGMAWLDKHHATVNALNVFPVPDGDTGTNMLLTMRSAWRELANIEDTHAGRVCQKLYNGALMGARGNSGVILSQLWRGFAKGIENCERLDTQSFVRGFEEASRMAYQAVQEPVEGTMLTVAREAAEEAALAAEENIEMKAILERVVERAHDAVRRTPEMLHVLAEAGVVDSGGMGFTYVLEGMLRYLNGESLDITEEDELGQDIQLQSALTPEDELGYGYDVQFLIKGQDLNVVKIRADIEAMGDSTLVVGDENLIKVHVHVHNPGVPVGYGADQGVLLDVVVENMQEQYQEFVVHGEGPKMPTFEPPQIEEGSIATITVAPGDGLTNIFYSLGAGHVIAGGQTMNPSTEQIVEAINSLPTDKIVILPNNKNIFMAAEQAASLANSKQVRVIATRTIPQGISAMLALDPQGDLDDMAEAMLEASQMVETGEITKATRSAKIDDVKVKKGQIIGLHNDVLKVAGDDIPSTTIALLNEMGLDDLELITLYYGMDVSPRDAETLAEHLEETLPNHEIELREGGQAHYYYILSAE